MFFEPLSGLSINQHGRSYSYNKEWGREEGKYPASVGSYFIPESRSVCSPLHFYSVTR